MTVSMATAGAEFRSLVFSSVAGAPWSPLRRVPWRRSRLSLDFDESAPSACRDAASGAEVRATPVERTRGPWGGALHVRARIRIENSPTFQNAVRPSRPRPGFGPMRSAIPGDPLQANARRRSTRFTSTSAWPTESRNSNSKTPKTCGPYQGTRYPLPVVPLGRWSHVAATFDRVRSALYLDGRRAAWQTQPERLLPNVLPLGIGEGRHRVAAGRSRCRA